MDISIIFSFITAFLISVCIVPVIGRITTKLGIIAHTNNRTVHKGIIPRTGGYGIYVSFLISAMIFLKTDTQINSILIGGFIIFLVGFYDDIHDLSPKLKLLGQIVATLVVIFYGGISLKDLNLPFVSSDISYIFSILVTMGWIIGITNAINLIDGLDGLCAGISIIVLFTISMTALSYGRTDITSLSMVLSGAIFGFLIHNFHPAKIFMGDCGALFIGFMIAVISLLGFGFKSSTFFTLGAPIVVLAVPITDTIIAIIRRKVAHKRFDEADRSHLHHQLMFSLKLGQTRSVIILYIATALFSLCSYLYNSHKLVASLLFLALVFIFELFVEFTDMISRKYKPILTLINLVLDRDDLPHIRDSKTYAIIGKKIIIPALTFVLLVAGVGAYYYERKTMRSTVHIEDLYENHKDVKLLKTIHNDILNTENYKDVYPLVAAYFAVDYYNLSDKTKDEIGGLDYFYKSRRTAFKTYSLSHYYKDVNTLISEGQSDIVVDNYTILSTGTSDTTLSGLENNDYYSVTISLEFKKLNPIINSKKLNVKINLVYVSSKYYVIGIETK